MTYFLPSIEQLVEYFKFGYTGATIDLIYLIIVGYLLFKFIRYTFYLIKKKGVFAND